MHLPLRSNQYYETLRGGYMDCIYKQNVKQRQGRWWWKTLARHLRQPRFDTSAISATPGENTLPPPLNPAPSPPPSVCGQQPDALRLTSDGGTTSTANNSTSIPWVSTAAPWPASAASISEPYAKARTPSASRYLHQFNTQNTSALVSILALIFESESLQYLQLRLRVPSNERSDDRVANNEDGSAGWWEHGKARYPLLGLLKYCSEPEDRPLPRLALRSQANIKQEAIRGIYFRVVLKILSVSEPIWFYVARYLFFLGKRYMAICRIIANAFH